MDHRVLLPAAATIMVLSAPTDAAEPFSMQASDVTSEMAASPADGPTDPFRMFPSDIVYTGTERADDASITRGTEQAVTFRDDSSAANAQIIVDEGGAARFFDRSTAETALVTVNGEAGFTGAATAGDATIVVNASGRTIFTQTASAGSAAITNNGMILFEGEADAGTADIVNNEGGALSFSGDASAGGGLLTNSGTTSFSGRASAADRFLANNETGRIAFAGQASAGTAVFGNSGTLEFGEESTLDRGRIVGNRGGTIAFTGDATAQAGEIAHAGTLRFSGRSSAGTALIETQTGGATYFVEAADGGLAQMRLQDGAILDFSGLTTGGTSVGSLLGTGRVFLGANELTVGGNNLSTTVAGLSDGGAAGGTGGSLVKTGTGTLRLEGPSLYTGATRIESGTLQAATANAFAPGSAVVVFDNALLDLAGFDQEIGSLAGAGTVDLAANSLTTGRDGRSTVFSGVFAGSGGFVKQGTGTFTLTGASQNFGASTVAGGTLSMNGNMPLLPLSVLAGARLEGGGTLGSLNVASGGTIAPGNSIGTLTVDGDAIFSPGATFAVETAADGASNRLDVGGTAFLGGAGVSVTTLDPTVSYRSTQRYTILAAGTREGEFSGATMANESAFLRSSLAYEGATVSLLIDTIAQEPPVTPPTSPGEPGEEVPPSTPPSAGPRPLFARVAQSSNQLATASALDTLTQAGESLALYNAILFSNMPNARASFDQLSGEGHASVQAALVDDSRHLRDAVVSRIDETFSLVEQGSDGGRSIASGPWLSGFGNWGRTDRDGNVARTERDIGGVLVGADVPLGTAASLGLFGGFSHGSIDVDARRFSADVDTAHIGTYGAVSLGAVEFSAGAAHSWSDIETHRTVAFSGFVDTLSASYDAQTTQLFGELGYRAELGGIAIKPFAGIAYVHLDVNGFAEQGGPARLVSGGGTSETLFSTVGLRANREARIAGRSVQARGMIGWRHAAGGTPTSTLSFISGSPFTVQGAKIPQDAAVIEAGLSVQVTPTVWLDFDYVGQFGDASTTNGLMASVAARF